MRKVIVNLELFGMPRVVAGTNRITTSATHLGDVLSQAIKEAPDLREHVLDTTGTWLNAGYTFVVDGQFTNDPSQPVNGDSDVLLVSRASGG